MSQIVKAKEVCINDTIFINGSFGYTYLVPCGNLVVGKTEVNNEVTLLISGFDGDFMYKVNSDEDIIVDK